MNILYSDAMSQPNQLKMSMPPELLKQLQAKAKAVGVPVSLYLKHVIVTHLETGESASKTKKVAKNWTPPDDLPTFPASKWVEASYRRAMRDKSKALRFDTVDEMFEYVNKLK